MRWRRSMNDKHIEMSLYLSRLIGIACTTVVALSPLACGGSADQRFAAESYDEYSEPLTNAVIGTPTGTVVVDQSGSAQAQAGGNGGSSPASPPPSGGTGGSTGGEASDGGVFFD